jgi:hypothetical protein
MGVKRLAITAVAAFIMASAIAYGLLRWHRFAYPDVPPPPVEELPEAVVVYCMQDDERGPMCRKIEKLTQEVLDQSFGKELQDGRVKWLLVNYELPDNKFIIKEYDIVKPTIVVVDGRPGMKRAWKNHQRKVRELIDDEKAFKEYMRDEIQKALKDVPLPDAR